MKWHIILIILMATIVCANWDTQKQCLINTNCPITIFAVNSTNTTQFINTTSCSIDIYSTDYTNKLVNSASLTQPNLSNALYLYTANFNATGHYPASITCIGGDVDDSTDFTFDVTEGISATVNSTLEGDIFMPLATIIGIGFLCMIFLYFAFNLGDNHFLLKLLLIFFCLITAMLIPTALIKSADLTETHLSFLKNVMWFFRLFVIYFAVYLSYDWLKRSKLWVKYVEKKI